jgi:hypothetical protein
LRVKRVVRLLLRSEKYNMDEEEIIPVPVPALVAVLLNKVMCVE